MLDFSRFQFLTFDCYGTLINWEGGILPVVRSILAAHGKHADGATLVKLYGDLDQRPEASPNQSDRQLLGSVVSHFSINCHFAHNAQHSAAPAAFLPRWKPC